MAASFVHRLTGLALSVVGVLVLTWYLWSVASGPQAFDAFASFAGSWFGKFVLIGLTWSLIQHTASGIRHLAMDLGFGFAVPTARVTALSTFLFAAALTGLIWVYLLFFWH